MNLSRSSLPTRIPGARLRRLTSPPKGGWFGTDPVWPSRDLDQEERKAVEKVSRHSRTSSVADTDMTPELLERVYAGIERLGTDTDQEDPGGRA